MTLTVDLIPPVYIYKKIFVFGYIFDAIRPLTSKTDQKTTNLKSQLFRHTM